MYCPKCGWNNPDDTTQCANCQADLPRPAQPQPTQQMPQQPYAQQPYALQYQPGVAQSIPDYLAWSIIVTVLSFLCYCLGMIPLALGIVGIVRSAEANSKKSIGDYYGALQAANSAKTWMYWAAGLEIAGVIGWITFVIIMIAAGGFK
jgi:hypothetical protein